MEWDGGSPPRRQAGSLPSRRRRRNATHRSITQRSCFSALARTRTRAFACLLAWLRRSQQPLFMVHAAAVRDACPQAVAPAFPCAFLTCLPALPTGSCQSSWRTANEDAYVGLAQAAWRWCSLRCMLRGEELQHYEIVEQPGLE